MRKSFVVLTLAGLLSFAALANAQTPAPAAAPAPAPAPSAAPDPALLKAVDAIKQSESAVNAIKDATFIFYKKEWKKGKNLPLEKATAKIRIKPQSVYMRWIGEEKKNQEVIWVKGWNDGKIKTNQLWGVSVDPDGSLAMKDSRHPIYQAGFKHTVDLLARDVNALLTDPSLGSVKDLGARDVHGTASLCYEATLNKDKNPKFYGYKAEICVGNALKLPTRVVIWDKDGGSVREIENYEYENIKINVGLGDTDFDPKNPEYKY